MSGLNDLEKSTLMLGGKGVESFMTRFKMQRRHVAVSAAIGLIASLLVWLVYFGFTSPTTHSILANEITFMDGSKPQAWTVMCRRSDFEYKDFKCGSRSRPDEFVKVPVSLPGGKSMLTQEEYKAWLSGTFMPAAYAWFEPSPSFSASIAGLLSLGVMGVVSFYAFRFFVGFGREETKNVRIDGVYDLVDDKTLSKMVRESETGASGWTLAGVDLPKKSMVMGVSVVGAQGSGKSLALHDLIVQAERQDVRLFVNDPSGEFWMAHGKPENGDVYFNPALAGGVNWSIFSELEYQYDSEILAFAFLPKRESKGNGDFFDDAARSLFSALVRRLAEGGAVNTNEIASAFFETTEDELAALVSGTAAADAVSQDAKGMRAGVMASAAIHMSGIQMMAPGNWSLREFLRQPKGNIYFVGDEAKFRAVKRLMFSTAMEMIKAKGEIVPDIKYLFILDEYPVLGDIDVEKHLAEKRKFGVGVIVGMQAETQLETVMGKDRAATTLSVLNTNLQLRIPDPAAQKKAEERFGKQEIRMVGENQTLAVAETKDSLGVTKNVQEKALIPAANFGLLELAQGYIKVLGNLPAAKVDYRWWFAEGSSSSGTDTRANEVNRQVRPYPDKDERFRLVVAQDGLDWRTRAQVDLVKARIYSLEQSMAGKSGAKAEDTKAAILSLRAKLAALMGAGTDQVEAAQDAEPPRQEPKGLMGTPATLPSAADSSAAVTASEAAQADDIGSALDDLLADFDSMEDAPEAREESGDRDLPDEIGY